MNILGMVLKIKSGLQVKLIIIVPKGKAIKMSGENSRYEIRFKLYLGEIYEKDPV